MNYDRLAELSKMLLAAIIEIAGRTNND